MLEVLGLDIAKVSTAGCVQAKQNALAIPAGAAAYAVCALLLDRCVLQCSHIWCT